MALRANRSKPGSAVNAEIQPEGVILDDLVLTPVNQLRPERNAKCLAAKDGLATRIAEYRPLAIVSLLMSIRIIMDAAAIAAGSDAPRFAVTFPGNGNQARFKVAMAQIVPTLPRLPDVS